MAECWIWHGQMVHDACIDLDTVGTTDSIPALIYALKFVPPAKAIAGGPPITLDTTEHCQGALRTITSRDFGIWAKDWEAWWVASGHTPIPDPPQNRQRVQ